MRRFNYMAGTRNYNFAAATRTAVAVASSSAVSFGTLSELREVMITSDVRCFVAFGDSNLAAADGTSSSVLPIEANEKFHLRLPPGVTHYRVIRDTIDGFLRTYPVI